MNSTENFFSSSDEEDSQKQQLIKKRRFIRQRADLYGLPDIEFLRNFGVRKRTFEYVLEKIKPKLKAPVRTTGMSIDLKLAASLRILAKGSYQHGAGNDFNLGLAQPTISILFNEMLDILETELCPTWIKMPSEDEKSEAKEFFFQKYRVPGIIGCVDGTHIGVQTPSASERSSYYNRKGFYSLNAMVVCDHKMRIRSIDARYSGSNHDAFVWRASDIRSFLQEKYENGERNTWLLGDAGYPLEPFLITPYRSVREGTSESNFNMIHSKARNVIERTIGVLKNRFRCLLTSQRLMYKVCKAKKMINVCSALHNICIHFGDDLDVSIPPISENSNDDLVMETVQNPTGVDIRDRLSNILASQTN